VIQNLLVIASGILKGIGKDGKAAEGFLFVDAKGECKDGGSAPGKVQ